jgi:adenosylcobinamide-phosphate synthase
MIFSFIDHILYTNSIPVSLFVFVAAVVLDFILGDPRWLPHPVRWIGSLISVLDRLLYPKRRSSCIEFFIGIILCLLVTGITVGCGYLFLLLCKLISPAVLITAQIIIIFFCLSTRSLGHEALVVYRLIKNKDITSARKAVSMIVGRDTGNLNESEIARAAIETVAENITDGIVSPIFYIILGGPLAGLLFKSVSTMDSMIGYRNDRYKHFGTFAARLDDLLNFIPARLTAFLLLPVTSLTMRKSALNTWKVVIRDRRKHPSPNSAHSEAAIAGALNIRLGGEAYYQGKLSVKPFLNENGREPSVENIKDTVFFAWCAACLMSLIGTCIIIIFCLK